MAKTVRGIAVKNYFDHKLKWKDCDKCSLCSQRTNVVLARGHIPAPILFAGEAPGNSEDILAKPFVGPAGHLLDFIIDKAIDGQFDYCLTNLVCCIPKGEDGAKTAEPPKEAILACAPRLRELVELVAPQLIIRVGSLATKWVHKCLKCEEQDYMWCDIVHPAAILRAESQKNLMIKRSIVQIESAIEELHY